MTILLSGPEKRYAKALFELAEEAGSTALILADLSTLAAAVNSHAGLYKLLGNPLVASAEKAAALLTLRPKSQKLTQTLLNLLAQKKRLELVAGVAQCFASLVDEKEKCVRVVVRTPYALTDVQKKQIEALAKKHAQGAQKITMTEQLDPRLIAGLSVQIGSTMVDASLAGSLAALKRKLSVV